MRRLVVEIDDWRCPLCLTATVGGLLLSKQCGDIHASAHRLRQQRVQLRGCEDTEAICELEDVNHDRLQARECTAANDIEIEIRQDAAHVRKEVRPVERDDRELPRLRPFLQEMAYIVGSEVAAQLDVFVDAVAAEEGQVAARQPFEKLGELVITDR